MAFRAFRDSRGAAWQAWAVVPRNQHHRPRAGTDRRSADPILRYGGPERRGGTERRLRATLTPGLEGGWLVFESAAEKRRLTPIPSGWDSRSDAELEELCGRARTVPRIKLI